MDDFKFELGSEAKDKITNFKGVIRARSQYLTGCNTYGMQSQKLNKDGMPPDWIWFDEEQLILIKKDKVLLTDPKPKFKAPLTENKTKHTRKTGGPQEASHYPPK